MQPMLFVEDYPMPLYPTLGRNSENFQKIMKLVEHIAQLEEDYTHRGTIAYHLTPREKVCGNKPTKKRPSSSRVS